MNSKPKLAEVPHQENPEPEKPGRKRGLRAVIRGLHRRKVCRCAISYVLVMWLNLQIGDVIFPMLGLPDWTLSLIIIIGVMGFPVMLVLAWAFQITADGIVLDTESSGDGDRQLDAVLNVLLLLFSCVLSILLVAQFTFDEERSPVAGIAPDGSSPYVVTSLIFNPAGNQKDNEVLAAGVRNELRHRLILHDGIELQPGSMDPVSPGPLADPAGQIDQRQRLSLSGSLLLDGHKAHVLAHLINLSTGRYLMSVAFNVEVASLLDAETTTAARIMEELEIKLLRPTPAAADVTLATKTPPRSG